MIHTQKHSPFQLFLVSSFSKAPRVYLANNIFKDFPGTRSDEAQSKPALKPFQRSMTPANNACKPSVSHSNSVSAPRSGLRGSNYTTVAVYTDMHGSDVPVSAVSGSIRIATTTDTSTPAVNISAFAWSNSIIIKAACDRTQVAMMSPMK